MARFSPLAALLLANCIFPSQGKPRPTYAAPLFGDYVWFIKASTTEEIPYKHDIPTIPTSLEFKAPLPLESPFRLGFALASLDATKICFHFKIAGAPVRQPAEDLAKAQLEHMQSLSLAVRGLTSLTPELSKPLWPTPAGATHLDTATVVSDEIKDFDASGGTVERRRVVIVHACAPAPEITSATKFIAVTIHDPAPTKPDYKDPSYAIDDRDRRNMERDNQEERFKADALLLIAITDGAPDLSQ